MGSALQPRTGAEEGMYHLWSESSVEVLRPPEFIHMMEDIPRYC